MSTLESSTSQQRAGEQARPRISLQVSERRILLLAGDVLVLALAGAAALWGWARMRPDIRFTAEWIGRTAWWPLGLGLAWLLVAAVNSAYDVQSAAGARWAARKLLLTAITLGLLYGVVFVLLSTRGAPGDPFAALIQVEWRLPRVIPAFFLPAALALSLAWRGFYALVLTGDNFRRRALVVGAGWAGRNGRPFRVFKFRSMVPDAEAAGEAVWACEEDPRITRFGKLMRRTRLDELPQLWNVLRGEMSLIGPRPERPEFIAELKEEIPFYEVRHLVRPGLSGWAQVRYRYGNTKKDALVKLQYDLYYIKHRSPFLNLLILWRTVGVVLRFEGT